MGIRRNLSEVSERVGAGTADFYDKLADSVKTFACSLYNSFPDQITQNKNLAASFARGFMDATCGGDNGGTGNVPPPPGTGGRTTGWCSTLYIIYIDYEFRPGGTNDRVARTDLAFNGLPGPLTDIETTILSDRIRLTVEYQPPGNQSTYTTSGAGIAGIYPESVVVRIERSDGQSDNCLEPNATYPPTSPTVNDYTTEIIINNNDGTDLTIPLVYAPIDFNFPMNFNLGGIDVTIDLGGIDFNFGPGGVGDGGGQLPDGQQDPLPIPRDNPGGGNTTRKFPPPNTEDFDEIIKQPSTEDTELEGELLDYVTLQLTTIPANANTQVWVDGATVYYCGWFAFISDTFVFKREPIHFEFTIWNAPKGATGYQYQLYPGFQATATVYKRKINQDGST